MSAPLQTGDTHLADKLQLLFVDDEERSRKYFRLGFAQDFNIHTAASVDEAEDYLQQHGEQVAVVITDQRMPQRSGTELLQLCRQKHPHILRILTTAHADLEEAIKAVNQGEIFRFVTKPWDLEQLGEELRDAVAIYRQQAAERKLLQEKRKTALAIGAHIAHELRTPLAAIEMGVTGIGRHLPELIDGYHAALQGKQIHQGISEQRLDGLLEVQQRIVNSVRTAHTTIDLLLANIRAPQDTHSQFEWCNMLDTIETLRTSYPFPRGTQDWLQIEGIDFCYRGSEALIIQVLGNLIRNSIDALQSAPDTDTPEIRLSLVPGDAGQTHRLLFRDNGPGIRESNLPRIFDDFFTTKTAMSGNGLGLGFSQRVMRNLDGDLVCESHMGEYTLFTLSFPNHLNDAKTAD